MHCMIKPEQNTRHSIHSLIFGDRDSHCPLIWLTRNPDVCLSVHPYAMLGLQKCPTLPGFYVGARDPT